MSGELASRALLAMEAAQMRKARRQWTTRVTNALEVIGLGLCQLEVLFLAGGVFLVEGMLLVNSGIIVRTLEVRWDQTLWHTTALATSIFIGVTIGTVSGGFSSDIYGRRPAIITCYIGSIVLVLLSAAGMNFAFHMCTNLVMGFFFGFGVPAANALICECCPIEQRSGLVCSSAMMFAVGQVVAGLIVWVVTPEMDYENTNWRLLACLSAIVPSLIAPFVYLRLCESTLWLAVSGDFVQCKETLALMAYRNGACLDTAVEAEEHLPLQTPRTPRDGSDTDGGVERRPSKFGFDQKSIGVLQDFWERRAKVLFSPRFRSITLIMTFVTFSSNFCYFGMIYILPDTFVEVMMWFKNDDSDAATVTPLSPAFSLMLSAAFEIPGVLLAIMLATSTSRRTSLVLSFGVTSIAALALVSASTARDRGHAAVLTSIAAFSGKLVIASAFILVYLYLLEVYPTSIRASGLAFAMTVGRIGAFCVPLVAEALMHLTGSSVYLFLVIGLDACLAALLCLCLPSVSNEPLDQAEPQSPPGEVGRKSG